MIWQNIIAAAIPDAERATALVPHLIFLAQAHEELGEYDAAREHLQHAFEVANSSALSDTEAFWLNFQYAELLNRRIIPRIAPGHEDKLNALKAQAVEHYHHALVADHSLRNASKSDRSPFPTRTSRHRFHALNTIGVLLSNLGRYQESVPFFEQAIQVDATVVQPLGNLALALTSLGQQETALQFNERALKLSPNQPLLLHNMGLILQTLDRQHEAIVYWERAHELNPSEIETISAIAGYYYSDRGDMPKAREYLGRAQRIALNALASDPTSLVAMVAYNVNRLRLANAQLPYVYQSVHEILDARAKYTARLQDLLNEPILMLSDPFKTANIGGLGYYAVYQGFHDVGIRSQLAQIYQRGTPALSFTAPHVLDGRYKVHHFPLVAAKLSYQTPVSNENVTVVHHTNRNIRVGFHSSFLRHHSVGLLTQGVIMNLPRDAFEVIVIIYEANPRDELTEKVLKSADKVVLLGKSLAVAQQQVAELQLDVLVFTEIGMDLPTYFLAFSRLALRTAVFWGHAVTSGIDTVDYFISSTLFQHDEPIRDRDKAQGEQQQLKYTECVYKMRHLTTYFLPPVDHQFPQSREFVRDSFDNFRDSLGLPSRQVLEAMFLVPQTLYKLHPDFDILIEGILSQLPHTAFLAVLTGTKPWLADDIRERWRQTLSPQVYKRIYFIRLLNSTEFMDVCAMADVVLDPFPVGGGRSSLEIFAVGTPIVMLAPRTTILQLTAAMYKVMGFDDLIAFSEVQYVALAVQLALEPDLRAYFKNLILSNNRKLYKSEEVLREWSRFFVDILAAKPPAERTATEKAMARFPPACPRFPSASSRLRPHSGNSSTASEPYFEIQIRIDGNTQGYGPDRNEFTVQLQSPDDDPFETTIQNPPFIAHLDLLYQYFAVKMCWNAQVHHHQALMMVFPINLLDASTPLDPIEVHYGDDLHLMVRAHLLKQIKRRNASIQNIEMHAIVHQLVYKLKLQVPMQSSPQWIAARSFPLKNRLAVHSKPTWLLGQCMTLVITTCKRLALFMRMMASLERALGIVTSSDWEFWFCQILVIDDNSSLADRQVMQKRVPSERFQFYFKTPEERGHAKSLNIALGFIRSRYVMYLEDDWEFTGTSTTIDCVTDALAILQAHQTSLYEPLALVLLNNQRGGWERSLTTQTPGSNSSRAIRYALHEYAVSDPAHTFSNWPGFSLNPGIWDLHAISQALGVDLSGSSGTRGLFDEQTDIFEQLFSVRVWKSGLRVAFLVEEHALHIGAPPGSNGSAYVLNGLPRRFDAPGTPLGP